MICVVLSLNDLQLFKGLCELLDEKGDSFCLLQDELLKILIKILRAQKMRDHDEALTVGKSIQRYLAVIGLDAPGVHKLRPVGEDQ